MLTLLTFLLIALSQREPDGRQLAERPAPKDLITVSGCVAQPPRTGSLSKEAGGGTSAAPNTAGIEANSNEPVDAFVLLDATPLKSGTENGRRDARTSYALQGHEAELATHRGHRVEIVGHPMPPPPAASSKSGGTPQRIQVQSIKMLQVQCSAAPVTREGGRP
jgi:hypothetical protein